MPLTWCSMRSAWRWRRVAGSNSVAFPGFGAFSVRKRDARTGRNPRTGAAVKVSAKKVPFFKPGKELRLNVNGGEEP